MAIVKLDPIQTVGNNTTLPEAVDNSTVSVFTPLVQESKVTSLLKYVEGYPWTINFYGQILTKNNTIENFDPTTPNLTQPYYEINGMILQVSSPLSSSYDQATGITTISGSGITPYTVTPNVGDVFIASVDNGEDGVFMVNSVTRKTYRKDTLYEISYNLIFYTSQQPSFITTLKSRIQNTYFFNKDTNFFNRDVLLKPSVKEAMDRLKYLVIESKEYYFSTFAQREAGGILIPGIDQRVYDPLLVNFITKIIDYSTLVDMPFFRHNYGDNKYIDQKSIYDVLFSRNINQISGINKKFNFVSVLSIPNKVRFGTIGFTNCDYVLYPVVPFIGADISSITQPLTSPVYISNLKTTNNYTISNLTVQTANNNSVYTTKLLPDLFINNSYIVTDSFYSYLTDKTQYTNLSYIEILIYKHISKQAIAKEDLVVAIETYMSWSLLEQLYILPILWFLIKSSS